MLHKSHQTGFVKFIRLLPNYEPGLRLLVSDSAKPYLERKVVEEIRIYNENNKIVAPDNLLGNGFEVTSSQRDSTIWSHSRYLPLGHLPTPKTTSPVLSPRHAVSIVSAMAMAPSKYLSTKDNEHIKQWTKDITEPGDPGAAPEPPIEEAQPKPRRQRRVKVDSDDEDEAPTTTGAVDPNISRILDRHFSRHRVDDSEKGQLRGSQCQLTEMDDPGNASFDIFGKDAQTARWKNPVAQNLLDGTDTCREVLPGRGNTEEDVGTNFHIDPEAVPIAETTKMAQDTIRKSGEGCQQEQTEAAGGGEQLIHASNSRNDLHLESQAADNPVSLLQPLLLGAPVPVLVGFDPSRYGQPKPGETRINRLNNSRGHNYAARGEGRGGRQPSTSPNESKPLSREKTRIRSTGRTITESNRDRSGHERSMSRGTGPPLQYGYPVEVDESEEPSTPIKPPPGFDIRIPASVKSFQSPPQPNNFLDTPIEAIQRPALRPSSSGQAVYPAEKIIDGESQPFPLSNLAHGSGRSYVTSSNTEAVTQRAPKFDIEPIRKQQLEKILEMQKKMEDEKKKEDGKIRGNNAGQDTGRNEDPLGPQRQQIQDEQLTRKFHNTMGLGAPNPGKAKRVQKQETQKEKRERIERAKREAFGDIPPANQQRTNLSQQQNPSSYTNATAGRLFQPAEKLFIERSVTDDQVESLVKTLGPLFESVRACSGVLNFEIQFGKVMAPFSTSIENELFPAKKWNELFNPQSGRQPLTSSFTNMLTSNGADIDRLLEIYEKKKVKMFDKTRPGPNSITYEFQCQSKDNDEFWLVVDQFGNYSLRKASSTIAFVCLHYPGQVWDASAVIQGSLNVSKPSSVQINQAAKDFVDSLYIPADQHRLTITYRLPSTNELTIRNLVVKRVSLHDCGTEGREGLQLKVTEVKMLYHRFNQKDKKMGQGFEKDWPVMVQDGKIHYEVSLIDPFINQVFENYNKNLELGEMTDAAVTGKTLLKAERFRKMLDLTTVLLAKMDWMGATNSGSLLRMYAEEQEREMQRLGPIGSRVAASAVIPPTATKFNPSNFGASTKAMDPSGIGNSDTQRFVPGVRMNTVAGFFEEEGKWYRHGMGGARVPVPTEEAAKLGLMPAIEEEHVDDGLGSEFILGPDDSASQIGGVVDTLNAHLTYERRGTRGAGGNASGKAALGNGRVSRGPGWNRPDGYW